MTRRTLLTAAALAPAAALASQTVADVIAQQGAANVWASVQRMAQSSAGWLLIARRAAFAECLADTCKDMGLTTVGDVEAFVWRCGLSYAEVQALFPAVTLAAGRAVTPTEMHVQASQQFSLTKIAHGDFADFDIQHGDDSYETVSASDAAALAAAFSWRSAEFAQKKWCEHLVTLFKGECIRMGYAGRAIGLAGLDLFDVGRHVRSHAVPFVYTDERTFLLLDNGKVFPARQAKFFGCPQTVTNSKLRLLQI